MGINFSVFGPTRENEMEDNFKYGRVNFSLSRPS